MKVGTLSRTWLAAVVATALLPLAVRVAAETTAWPPVHAYAPSEALADAAVAAQVPVEGIQLAAAPREPLADDAVVLLVVLDERVRQTQWLVRLRGPIRVVRPIEKGGRATVVYGMDGRPIRFGERREKYQVLSLGPVVAGAAGAQVSSRTSEVTLDASFLDERFDRAARFMLRTGVARREGKLRADEWFTVLPEPPSPPDAAARERFVAATGLTDEDERAVAATVPSLNEFARVIARTPGLSEVLFSVVEKPSVWSIVSRFGRFETDFRFRSGEVVPSGEPPLGFAGIGPCYVVPFTFSINGKVALECTMLVAEPRPPLRMCGGIVAVVAESPDRPDARLLVRVLATRPADVDSGGAPVR